MTSSLPHRTRLLTLVVVGALMGMAAALVAGVQVAQRATDGAVSLAALGDLAESSTRLHAAVGQTMIVLATSPAEEDRALRLAISEARTTLEAMPPAIAALDPTDRVLVSTAEQYAAAAEAILEVAETGSGPGSEQPSPVALELAHRILVDAINGRRTAIRSDLAASVAGGGTAAVTATAVAILVLPLIAMFVFVRSLRSPSPPTAPPASAAAPTPTLPARLTRELEDRASAILDHARIVTWTRPSGQEAAPYRSLLSEAGGLLSVTRNLLAFDRLEAGEVLVSVEPTDLGDLAERIRLGALDTGVTIEVVADHIEVLADAVRLHQCLENLVGVVVGHGALKVGLVVGREKGRGTVCVVGEGCTVPAEVLRALQNESRPQRAAALALAVVRRLVAAMAGTIIHRQVDATAVFTVTLPLVGGRRR
jgi:signal transduction histidine kinase